MGAGPEDRAAQRQARYHYMEALGDGRILDCIRIQGTVHRKYHNAQSGKNLEDVGTAEMQILRMAYTTKIGSGQKIGWLLVDGRTIPLAPCVGRQSRLLYI